MTDLPETPPTRILPITETEVLPNVGAGRRSDASPDPVVDPVVEPASPRPIAHQAAPEATRRDAPQRTALVVLAAMGALALTFIVLMVVGVTSEAINALAVIATPIASMVAAYYGITLSIQQVKNERAEKERALERVDAAITAARETEVWAAQMESGLRVAMAKLQAARVNTDAVTKAAGTPDDFF